MRKFFNISFILLFGLSAFVYRDKIYSIWSQAFTDYFPCKIAITYSIGTFDDRFGLSQKDFLSAMSDAEKIWEKPVGKDLFKYTKDGNIKINLIYDKRQASTEQLHQIGAVVDDNKSLYNQQKVRYDDLNSEYRIQKATLESAISAFEIRKNAYETEVLKANRRGGADKATFDRLNTEKNYLNTEAGRINTIQNSLNILVREINNLAVSLNALASKLNIVVDKYNTVGTSLGGEFDEGVYKTGPDGREIDIYQFDNRSKLVRVLAHELGHALGLEHIDDPKAIMYRLNNGINEKLTSTDLTALQKLCGIMQK